jgi:hypothetical protein
MVLEQHQSIETMCQMVIILAPWALAGLSVWCGHNVIIAAINKKKSKDGGSR